MRTSRRDIAKTLPVLVTAVGALLLSMFAMTGCTSVSADAQVWPASTTGRPTFYYFGSPG